MNSNKRYLFLRRKKKDRIKSELVSSYRFWYPVVRAGFPSRGGDVAVYVFDVNQPSSPTPFYSVLMPVSVFKVLSTVFPSINPPKRGLGCLMSPPLSGISGLSFDCTLLFSLLFFCLVLSPFLSYLFLPTGPFLWTFSRKFFNIFRFFVWLLFSS